jgi:histone chaperone ASF1
VTGILLTCCYDNQEFFRVGYYLSHVYENEELNLNPPEKIEIDNVVRSILSEKPRITKFNIDWHTNDKNQIPTLNNNKYMFDERKKTAKENIHSNFFN